MLVHQARSAAQEWVTREATRLPGFAGAFFSGSSNILPDDAPLPPTSDVDLLVVLDVTDLPQKPGKFLYRGALLEASYLRGAVISTPEQVLGASHLAWSFWSASIMLDPTGRLAPLQAAVIKDYAQRRWVFQRCAAARDKALHHLASFNPAAPLADQVTSWLFGAGVAAHILLIAGLRNPTVRTRYLAVRQLLAEYDRAAFYPTLLEMLGCQHIGCAQAEQHLASLAAVFDAAATHIQSPFVFAADLTPAARPVAIDGSRELIDHGDQREALFWIAVTHSRCQQVLALDASPELRAQHLPGYTRLLADLGLTSAADVQLRIAHVQTLLPQVWREAQSIINTNPEIEPD